MTDEMLASDPLVDFDSHAVHPSVADLPISVEYNTLVENFRELNAEKSSFFNSDTRKHWLWQHLSDPAPRTRQEVEELLNGLQPKMQSIWHTVCVATVAAGMSTCDFQCFVNFVTGVHIWQSKRVCAPAEFINRLAQKKNYQLDFPLPQQSLQRISCNRLIAACVCGQFPVSLKTAEITLTWAVFGRLSAFMHGEQVQCNSLLLKEMAVIAGKSLMNRVWRILHNIEVDKRRWADVLLELDAVVHLQEEANSLREENFAVVGHLMEKQFCGDPSLWHLIVKTADQIRPASCHLYERLFTKLMNERQMPPFTFSDRVPYSDLVELLKLDDDREFAVKWQTSAPLLKDALLRVPVFSGGRISHFCKEHPLISVVAFYGAIRCLRLILPMEDLRTEVHPLCLAIAGGNAEAIKLLDSPVVPLCDQIAYAVFYHQTLAFDFFMEKEGSAETREWLLPNCVEAHWYYGVKYCIDHEFKLGVTKAMQIALSSGAGPMFRLLLLFTDPIANFNREMQVLIPAAIEGGDVAIIRTVLSLAGDLIGINEKACLRAAIKSGSIEVIDAIWKPCGIPQFLLVRWWDCKFVNLILETKNRDIIHKFMEYGNIFTSQDIQQCLSMYTRNGDIAMIDLMTNGAKDYFSHWPQNLLPSCANVATARYLLEHGANPNGRGEDGRSLMHRAICQGDKAMLSLLREFGAKDVSDETSKAGWEGPDYLLNRN
jgi:hypothetical protein